MDSEEDDSEWRFSVDDLEDEADESEKRPGETARASGSDDTDGKPTGKVAGSLDVSEEIEAGDIDPENALFVVLGVVLTLLFVVGFVDLF